MAAQSDREQANLDCAMDLANAGFGILSIWQVEEGAGT
jgi:hypothetical protein